MAVIQMNFMSKSLMRTVNVDVVLPVDKVAFPGMPEPKSSDFQTIYLLHGVIGSEHDWLFGTRIQRWAENKGIAVVMPAGENMFYLDQPKSHALYGTFIGEELPELMEKTFPLSRKRENRYIAGLSMGGYGALRNGLKYHDRFSRIGAFSSALSVLDANERTNDTPIWLEGRDYAESFFGDLETVKESDRNPEWTLRKIAAEGAEIPEIYMSCGTKDSLYSYNVTYRDLFRNDGAKVTWDEGPYAHEWDFWDQQIERFLNWLPSEETAAGVSSGNVGI